MHWQTRPPPSHAAARRYCRWSTAFVSGVAEHDTRIWRFSTRVISGAIWASVVSCPVHASGRGADFEPAGRSHPPVAWSNGNVGIPLRKTLGPWVRLLQYEANRCDEAGRRASPAPRRWPARATLEAEFFSRARVSALRCRLCRNACAPLCHRAMRPPDQFS